MNHARADIDLMLVHRVFHMDHLHLGRSEPGKPITWDGARDAQREFTRHLITRIPAGTKTILDVGCGIGSGTKMLQDAGFAPEGVNPDPYQKRVFEAALPGVPFHHRTFESFEPAKAYDLVLFSESAQYVKLPGFFPGCAKALGPGTGGAVLVADWFCKPGKTFFGEPHDDAAFRAAATAAGFSLKFEEDITAHALPTVEFLSAFHRDWVVPAVDAAGEIARERMPVWAGLARVLLGGRINKVYHRMTDGWAAQFNPATFRESVNYRILLFTRGG